MLRGEEGKGIRKDERNRTNIRAVRSINRGRRIRNRIGIEGVQAR